MGRFDRESPEGLPPSLGTATQDLRATVEDKLREIVEAAEARAHEIEDRALEQALEIEQESAEKARRRFEDSSKRAEEMVAAIDAFEREVAQALESLREKGQTLASEFETEITGAAAAQAPAAEAPVAEPPAPAATAPEGPDAEAAAPEPAAAESLTASAETAESPPPAPERVDADDAREGVRKRILDLFLAGKPRRDAEFMLAQIDDSDHYTDLLDEVYESRSETQQGSTPRRGGRRRRRPGS
jgi:hypothetical protein